MDEDTQLTFALTGSDQDIGVGDYILFELVKYPLNGIFSDMSPPDLTYVPPANYTGAVNFKFRAVDKWGAYSSVKTVTINVINKNDPPDFKLTNINVKENMEKNIIIGEFERLDVEPDNVTYYLNGTFETEFRISGNHLLSSVEFNYESKNSYLLSIVGTDDGGVSTTKNFTISIDNVNDRPIAFAQGVETVEDTSILITLDGEDEDPFDDSTLLFEIVTVPSHGLFKLDQDKLIYMPNINFTGIDKFSFIVKDVFLNSFPVEVSINVIAVDDPPILKTNLKVVKENQPIGTDVLLLTVSDPEETTINVSLEGIDHSYFTLDSLVVKTAQAFNYESKSVFDFIVKAVDEGGQVTTESVQIKIQNVNDRPVVTGFSVMTTEDVKVDIVLNVSEEDVGDDSIFDILRPPHNGLLSGVPPNMVYQPLPILQV